MKVDILDYEYIEIFDIVGKIIYDEIIESYIMNNKYQIDINKPETGTYILNVTTNEYSDVIQVNCIAIK